MAILDTFYTLFKTNSEETKKGLQDADKAAKNFGETLSQTDQHVHAAGEKIVETFTEIGTAIAAAFAFERIKDFVGEVVEMNARLQDTSERIGVAVEDLSAMQGVAKRFGGSADGVTSSLDFLNRGLADIAVKGTSRLKPFFDELKINVFDAQHHIKSLTQVYGELADKMGGKSAQERAGLGERFQIDQGLILAMAEGRRGYDDLIARQKELGVTSAADAEMADKFEKKLDDLGTVFTHITNQILGGIVPVLSKLADGFMEIVQFLERHTDVVEGFFLAIGGVITAVYLPAMVRAAVATAVWLAEVLLIPALVVAAFAAFALAYDDVKNFLAGNKSVIGELSKRWPIIGEIVHTVVKDVAAAFDWWVSYMKSQTNLVVSVINLIVAVFARVGTAIGNLFSGAGTRLAQAFPLWTSLITGTANAISGLVGWVIKLAEWLGKVSFKALEALPKALGNLSGYINNAAVSVNGPKLALGGTAPTLGQRTAQNDQRIAATVAAMQKGQGQIDVAANSPIGAAGNVTNTKSQTVHKTTTVTVENINVQSASSDPNAVASAVGDHFKDHVRKAINEHDDGVAM